MIARIWETHKGFIIGIVVGILFIIVAYQVAVAPLFEKADKSVKRSADSEKRLNSLFGNETAEHPTRTTKLRYQKSLNSLKTELDDLRNMVGFPVQAPFVLPAGEKMAGAYYVDVFSKVKREIQVAANSRAISIKPRALEGRGTVEREKVPEAMVSLAVLRRVLLTAIAAGVTSIDAVTMGSGERSAPVMGYRLEEKLITVTVKGSSRSVQEWLTNIGRRDSFLMIASASIKGPEPGDPEEDVTAKIQIGPLTVKEMAPVSSDEEEG